MAAAPITTYADIKVNTNLSILHPEFAFGFEKDFRRNDAIWWFMNNWKLSFLMSFVYVVLVFSGTSYMKTRQAFNLRMPLAVWSACLAVFSFVGMMRLAAPAIQVVSSYGVHDLLCDPVLYNGVSGFWVWAFTLSKAPELGDTLFIVLRKQKLIFLHWYHHITVLMYTWFTYPQILSIAPPFCLMNFTVHTMMYSYYATKASRIVRIPTWVGIMITLLQTIQMLLGCLVNGYVYLAISNGTRCASNTLNIIVSVAMYGSYFVLFGRFFHARYLGAPGLITDTKKSA